MGSDTGLPTGTSAGTLACTCCSRPLTGQLLAIQSYTSDGTALPAGIPDHGGITLCSACASEVVELLAVWDDHGRPPVAAEHSIGDGYPAVVTACSFCGDGCESGVLGIELYRRVGDRLPAYANYTLCADCQSVFGEFLRNVYDACSSEAADG